MKNLQINLPGSVAEILDKLNNKGFKAFAVGGCIRDSIIGRKPADWDIATNARPSEVQSLFEKTAATGLAHGTITVILNGGVYEVTTFRAESGYADFRRPDSVNFGVSLGEDLKRRDFTVNALAYHPKTGIIDNFDGIGDIKRRIIRTVGNPDVRFSEDALRMLRAVRFAAQMNYSIDVGTLSSIKRNSHLIEHISIERIRDELTGILVSNNSGRMALLSETRLLDYILPELSETLAGKNAATIRQAFKPLDFVHCNPAVRWCVLLITAKASTDTARRLRLERKTVSLFGRIKECFKEEIGERPADIRRAVSQIGKDIFPCVLHIRKAFLTAEGSGEAEKELQRLLNAKRAFKEAVRNGYPLELGSLALNGDELSELGIPKGENLGSVLKMLLEAVLEEPSLNSKASLLKLLRKSEFI